MDRIRMGLIGCGGMGRSLVRAALETEMGELVAVCDQVPDLAKSMAEEFGGEVCDDIDALLGRDDVDVILVATPNFAHCDCVLKAAKTGKPIFCEKPMALSVEECDRMIEACRESGSPLMIGQVLRYYGAFAETIDLVRAGRIGEPIGIHVARIGYADASKQKPWRHSRKLSGGTLYEFGVHEIDFMRCVCGEVKSIFAVGDNYMHKGVYDYPDLVYLTMNFAGGAKGCYVNGHAAIIRWNETRVWGTEGALTFAAWTGPIRFLRLGGEEESIEVTGREPGVRHEMRLFFEAVREGKPMPIPGEEGRANVAVAEAALRSIETGQPIELS